MNCQFWDTIFLWPHGRYSLPANPESVPELASLQCLDRLFELQAKRTPAAPAVVAHDGQYTYAELDRQANQLAHYLQSLGIRPEMRVGIALPRSARMIVAALAVLKAGGAYVPIDPAYPPQRFRYLAEDSRISVLLTQRAVPEGVDPESIKVVPLEKRWNEISAGPEHSPESRTEGPNLAYIIYTSGSTGKPKGVMVSHENVFLSTAARIGYYAQPPRRFLVLSSFSFDSSVAGIFWTLLSGGELWLPPEGTQNNVTRIMEFVRQGGITHLLALPPLYKSLLMAATGNELQSLRTVIVAGEPCPAELLTAHFHRLPEASLFNEYGPTEATVWCTVYKAGPARHPVPIGTPIDSVAAHILGSELRPVSCNEPGELYIGGPQVARGYLDRPDLTAEKFLPDPFSKTSGARLYRTGDLARRSADGNMDFLGRTDQQVKIRGHRIELGEIESALREHPHIKDAAVAGKKDAEGHQRLVAYYVPATEVSIDAVALRRFLSQTLPAYMVPATYVMLGSLPLNVNGKLDHLALPDPQPAKSQSTYVAPRNQTEQKLTEIWAELLGVQRVGIHDDFFDLGGDSILGLQMAARANQAGLRLNVALITEQPTIAGLVAAYRSMEAPSGLSSSARTSDR
jgi:amino acid adenylation domain-containing protein